MCRVKIHNKAMNVRALCAAWTLLRSARYGGVRRKCNAAEADQRKN